MGKRTIIIEATSQDVRGPLWFLWAYADEEGAKAEVVREYHRDVGRHDHAVVVQLDVVEHWDRQTVTEYIDKVLLDLIAKRQVGKIRLAHDRWGEHPYQRLIRETEQEKAS